MSTDNPDPGTSGSSTSGKTDRIKESAHDIWLAGLGAFAKAQQEGVKAFEALVKDGMGLQKKTQAAAEEGLNHAQSRMSGMANEIGAKAAGQWGKLEGIFEDRVARALEKLGMPSAAEVRMLKTRLDVLSAEIEVLKRQVAEGRVAPAAAAKTTRPTGRKRAAASDAGTARKRSAKAGAAAAAKRTTKDS
ncbi:MAG: phasin family protein [Variovorax sp.]